jgi:hypothetical protein
MRKLRRHEENTAPVLLCDVIEHVQLHGCRANAVPVLLAVCVHVSVCVAGVA